MSLLIHAALAARRSTQQLNACPRHTAAAASRSPPAPPPERVAFIAKSLASSAEARAPRAPRRRALTLVLAKQGHLCRHTSRLFRRPPARRHSAWRRSGSACMATPEGPPPARRQSEQRRRAQRGVSRRALTQCAAADPENKNHVDGTLLMQLSNGSLGVERASLTPPSRAGLSVNNASEATAGVSTINQESASARAAARARDAARGRDAHCARSWTQRCCVTAPCSRRWTPRRRAPCS